MNRLIHAAVRRDLGRLSAGLERLADGDRARAEQLERAYANLRRELTQHHEGEDTYIWPMLATAGVDPDLLAAMESEHAAMSRALAETGTAMSTLAASGSAADAAAARASVVAPGPSSSGTSTTRRRSSSRSSSRSWRPRSGRPWRRSSAGSHRAWPAGSSPG